VPEGGDAPKDSGGVSNRTVPRLTRKLLYRPLDRAQADDPRLGGQVLADHVGIASVCARAR